MDQLRIIIIHLKILKNKNKWEDDHISDDEEPQFENENFHSIDVSRQNMTAMNGSPRISFHNTIQNNEDIVSNLRRSFDSSLMFETQNEVQLNKILNRRQTFNQVKINKKEISHLTKRKNTESVCRICLDSEDTNNLENPLLSPCKWTGSMKNVHLEWIKVWIQDKRNTRDINNTRSFNWKELKWELWKTIYSDEFYHKSK